MNKPTEPFEETIALIEATLDGQWPYADMARRILEHLQTRYGSKRPPDVAARVLALLIVLYEQDAPYPERDAVSQFLGCTPYGADVAISMALERELLSIEVRVTQSEKMKSRLPGAVRSTYYRPSPALLSIAGRADRA